MQNTNGLDSSYDITLSGESNAFFDTVNASTLVINRPSTVPVNTLLGSTINVGSVLQNSNFDTINRFFEVWNDTASNRILQIDTSNGNTVISADGLNLCGQITGISATDSIYLQSVYTIDLSGNTITLSNATVSFPNSTVSFDSNLPTTAITTGFASNNFITKAYSDGIYGRLAIANTWDENNTFSKGILPRASSSATDIQIGGVNQLQYRRSPSAFNISIGENAVRGYPAQPTWNVGQRNIGIGDGACQEIMGGNDNIGIGYRALKSASGGIYGQGVTPFRCIAIGSNSQTNGLYGTDNISVGYNCLQNIGSGSLNICMGSSVGNAIANVGSNIIIGNGAGPSVVDNAMTVIGFQACGGAIGQFNSGVAIGFQSFYSNNNGSANTGVGAMTGHINTSGANNTCIGCFAGRFNTSSTFNSTTTIGHCSSAEADREFVIGGNGVQGATQFLTLPHKTRLACNQSQTGVTINLTFRTNENILLTDATTSIINLPTPNADGRNEGAKFYINRRVAGVNITINSPVGQTIALNQINGTYTATGTYLFLAGMNCITLLCIGSAVGGTNWQVLPTSYSQGTDNLYTSAVNPIPATAISIPFAGTTISGYQPYFMDNANLNYRQSTTTLTATNISSTGTITSNNLTVTGTLSGTATNATNVNVIDKTGIVGPYYMNFTSGVSGNLPVNADSNLYYDPLARILLLSNGTLQSYKTRSTCYQYLGQETLITTATTLNSPLLSYYPFTMKTTSAYAVTVPQITSLNVGTQLVFKRIGGSLQTLSLTTVSNQPTFLSGNAIGTTTATNVIISATQSCCKIIATETQNAGTGTFTNVAGSSTITIDTQTSGTLAIGGIINCNGNVRYITAFLTGLGGATIGANTYTVNAVIAGANAGQNYTSSLTYGWCVESVS